MEKIRGDTVVLNGKITTVQAFRTGEPAVIIYEVIRLIDGHLLFLEDHLERLHSSCTATGEKCPDNRILKNHLLLLLNTVDYSSGNIKLLVFKNKSIVNIACFFIPHFYPSGDDYRTGVKTLTYQFQRPDPTIKKWNAVFRDQVGRFIQDNNIYEAILVNEEGQLSEGSRSNLFFIDKDDRIFTAPSHMILPGITRKYILNLCKKQNLEVIEQALKPGEASCMKSCFISGTSPKVLPVKSINQSVYDVDHPVIRSLMTEFNAMIDSYHKE
ncbi:MAG: aminotransferase class IV [Bacteroidales bacterium]|nr:aminotransferase class IV [Bacteroidales bacterium]